MSHTHIFWLYLKYSSALSKVKKSENNRAEIRARLPLGEGEKQLLPNNRF